MLLVLITTFSCQEKVDWELEMENDLRLVVNGRITNEKKAHEIHLTLPVYEINGEPRPYSGAEVYLSDGDTVINLQEDVERPGVYLTSPDIRGVVNKTYLLLIRAGNYEFTAAARMTAVTPIILPGYYQVSDSPPLYELFFRENNESSMMTMEMDWSHLPGYDSLPDEANHAVIYGYQFGPLSVDLNEIFSPARERVQIPPGTHVVIIKESLSEGYAEYLRGMVSETSWNGGLFDVKPGDPFTNVSSGGLGYFAATTVIRDTIVFTP